jgi:hypothetical protein
MCEEGLKNENRHNIIMRNYIIEIVFGDNCAAELLISFKLMPPCDGCRFRTVFYSPCENQVIHDYGI